MEWWLVSHEIKDKQKEKNKHLFDSAVTIVIPQDPFSA